MQAVESIHVSKRKKKDKTLNQFLKELCDINLDIKRFVGYQIGPRKICNINLTDYREIKIYFKLV